MDALHYECVDVTLK